MVYKLYYSNHMIHHSFHPALNISLNVEFITCNVADSKEGKNNRTLKSIVVLYLFPKYLLRITLAAYKVVYDIVNLSLLHQACMVF